MSGLWSGLGNRGFILIYVLWVTATVSVIVLFLSRDNRQIMHTQAALEARTVLLQEMESLREILRVFLRKGQVGAPSRSYLGHCRVEVADANHFLNLNRASFDEIRRLCLSLKIEDRQAEVIADSIFDWIDFDMLENLNGAEDNYYMSLRPSYRCKNAPLERYGELLLIRGIDREILSKMEDFVCFEGTAIDFRHAPPEVIYALTGDWNITRSITGYRQEYGLDDEAMRMLLGPNLYQMLMMRYTFDSRGHYRLTIKGSYKGFEEDIREWLWNEKIGYTP